jgi:phage-related protein (TIGR01555 family)
MSFDAFRSRMRAHGGAEGARERAKRYDGLGSVFEGVNDGLARGVQSTRYTPTLTLRPSDIEGLILHDWRARREIVQPMRDVVRRGLAIEGLPGWVDQKAVQSWLEGDASDGTPGLLGAIGDLVGEGDAYGGAILVAIAEDGAPSSEPVSLEDLRRVSSWEVLDRFACSPFRRNIGAPVDYWMVHGAQATDLRFEQVVHPSRVAAHLGAWMPRRWRDYRQGWGASVLEVLRDSRDQLGLGLGQLGRLLMRSTQDVVVLAELSELLEEEGAAAVRERINVMQSGLTSTGLLVLDGGISKSEKMQDPGRTADSFDTMSRPLGGAAEIAELHHENWRRGSTQPRVVADGEASGGINSGEEAGQWRAWAAVIEARQTRELTPWVNWGLGLIFASKDGPTGGRVPENWTIKWNPIAEEDHESDAKISLLDAQADRIYFDVGALTAEEIRQTRHVEGDHGLVRVESADLLPPPAEPDPVTPEANSYSKTRANFGE